MLSKITAAYKSNTGFTLIEKLGMIAFLSGLLFFVAYKDFDIFHRLVGFACGIMATCMLIISLYTIDISENINVNFIGLTYGFSGVFQFVQALYSPDSSIILGFSLCSTVFQWILVIFVLSKKALKINIKILFYLYTLLSILLFTLVSLLPISHYTITNGNFPLVLKIPSLLTILPFTICLIRIIKANNQINSFSKKHLLTYCSLIILLNIFILIDINSLEIHLSIGHIIKIATLVPIFFLITENAFKQPLELFFSNLKNKNSVLVKKEELLKKENRKLITKNLTLKKVNLEIYNNIRRQKQLLNLIPQGILLLKGSTVSFANQSFRQFFDIKAEDKLLGTDVSDVFPEEFRELFVKQLNNFYIGNDSHNLRNSFSFSSTKKIDLEYKLFHHIINNEDYVLVIFEDITERKEAQAILTNARLEEENEQLKIGFLANISHELRTPISLIYSAIQVQEGYMTSGNISQLQRYSKVIKQNCFRLLRIINNLIDATKIDASYFKANMRYMDIVKVVEDCALSVVPFVESKSMSLIFDTNVEGKYMVFDPDLIERIILNLLANSVKYGVPNGEIYVILCDNTDYIDLIVKDNGIGIPEDKIDLLFNRFTKIDRSFSRSAEGSGIGLYLVKKFVELHDGYIKVNSPKEGGVEFCISLPYSSNIDETISDSAESVIKAENKSNIIDKVNIEFSDIYS